MSLRHAILGVLSASPMTGYDLVHYFHDSVAYVWSAPQSQIYPELRKMEGDGLVRATVAPRGERAQKRIYGITRSGSAELSRWAAAPLAYPPDRDPLRLKAVFFDITPPERVRDQLQAHIVQWTKRLEQWEARVAEIREGRAPLIRRRLEKRPADEHERIVAYKAHAFDGNIARARAEIAWALRGQALVDELEEVRPRRGRTRARA